MEVLILGATANPNRYAYLALNDLLKYGHTVWAVGRRAGEVNGVKIQIDLSDISGQVDTVTIYLSAENQKNYASFLLEILPRRVIFNPGAENGALETELAEKGVEVLRACTLVMLRTNQF